MQTTSSLYKTITSGDFWYEVKLNVNGVEYGENKLISVSTSGELFSNTPSVGNAESVQIDIELLADVNEFPKMAELRPYVRAVNNTQRSEWLPQGVFYIDTRSTDPVSGVTTLHGYDAMLKTEAYYPEDNGHDYPMLDITMVRFIASKMGVEVDPRTVSLMNHGYFFPLPGTFTMRECLQMIAASYCGNFIMTDTGMLRLIGLNEIPTETRYLIDQIGYAITFGGDRILV